MPGIDKPTGRVVALIVLMFLAAAALRGYLPAQGRGVRAEPGGGRAALLFVIVTLTASLALLTIAVIARLRDPRAVAPKAEDLSDMLGTGKGRPSWRVILIGLALIVAWLLIVTLLVHYLVPHRVDPSVSGPAPAAQPSGRRPGGPPSPPPQHPPNNSGDLFGVLLAGAIPMMLVIVAGSVIMARRRWRAATPPVHADDHVEPPAPAPRAESLARAAEVGLAEIGDLSREPREAIIACYAAMERGFTAAGSAPAAADTPAEVLARAAEAGIIRSAAPELLTGLFRRARYSTYPMTSADSRVAADALTEMRTDLASQGPAP